MASGARSACSYSWVSSHIGSWRARSDCFGRRGACRGFAFDDWAGRLEAERRHLTIQSTLGLLGLVGCLHDTAAWGFVQVKLPENEPDWRSIVSLNNAQAKSISAASNTVCECSSFWGSSQRKRGAASVGCRKQGHRHANPPGDTTPSSPEWLRRSRTRNDRSRRPCPQPSRSLSYSARCGSKSPKCWSGWTQTSRRSLSKPVWAAVTAGMGSAVA